MSGGEDVTTTSRRVHRPPQASLPRRAACTERAIPATEESGDSLLRNEWKRREERTEKLIRAITGSEQRVEETGSVTEGGVTPWTAGGVEERARIHEVHLSLKR